jgi:membrane fusion protein, multidrug efflux system
MHARASIEGRMYPDRLLAPVAAVVERDQRSLVFTYEPTGPGVGRAWWRYVTVGVANDSLVAVESEDPHAPIEPGAMVIVEGHETLTHDALVRLAVPRPRAARSEPLP